MCDEITKRSEFYRDEERHKEACDALREMKKLRERRSHEMLTIILPTGARVSSTNLERLKEYEKYCKRKAGYFTQLK
jgi:radical SAM superfamily enzyme with C-terminal helix-hairpin-helix motif